VSDAQPKPVNQRIRVVIARVVALLCLPLLIFTHSAWAGVPILREAFEVAGIWAIVAAVLGRFWAILYVGGRKNNEVVQSGPYSICRHPLYFSTTIGAIGFGLMLGSLILAVVWGGLAFIVLSQTAKREEKFLRAEFSPDYEEYASRVPQILPNFGLFQTAQMVTFNTKTLRTNLADALGFLALIPLAKLIVALHAADWVPAFVLP